MDFYIIDQSSAATADPTFGGPLTLPLLTQMAASLEIQLNRDLAPYWGGAYRVTTGPEGQAAPGAIVCAILDALLQEPGAVAFHDVDGNALPVVFVARSMCNGIITGSVALSSALSHEMCETAGDPACNLWADDGVGNEWARELCDAVESNSYDIDGVAVSDFLLPGFFAANAMAPLSFMGSLALTGNTPPAPFGVALGGYQIKRASGGGTSQVTGAVRPAMAAKKAHWSSRTYRRGARVG